MSEFVQRIEKEILEHGFFARSQAILVAVSGGLDSMVLLRVLSELSNPHQWHLKVAHFNHQLRGRSSQADERLVRRTADQLGLPIFVEQADVRQFARQNKLSIEMAARQLRHEFFARVARGQHIRSVALAHHADDQVELFFLRLLRGTGVEGLTGMDWINSSPANPGISLVRPLLGTTKEEIHAFARERGIRFREDASNAALEYQRNRLRHELLPLLKQHYQPALSKIILRAMDILRAEDNFLTGQASLWEKKRRPAFDRLGPALQRRILQFQLVRQNLPVEFELIERLRSAPNKVVNINPELTVFRDQGGVVHNQKIVKTSFNSCLKNVDLTSDCGNVLFNGLKIAWERRPVKSKDMGKFKAQPGMEIFDAERLGPEIILRHWQAGDRFQPIGMPVKVKLQDLFTNQKIPRPQRHQLVLATTAGGEIFWVEGLRIGEQFKVGKNSNCFLQWQWQRLT